MNKKIASVLGVMFLAVTLVLPGLAIAEMYVEGYIGGGGGIGLNEKKTAVEFANGFSLQGAKFRDEADPAVIGGLKIGTWFVPTGFLGYNYPSWMQYFGFYTDFSFHRLDVAQHQSTSYQFNAAGVPTGQVFPLNIYSEGTAATWAFMFAARYGFFPDSEVPFGRLQPYVAVGPAILFTTQDPRIYSIRTGNGIKPDSQSSTNIALAVDAGIRYMALKNVSIDLSFKYRYATASYEYEGNFANALGVTRFKYEPTYNLLSGQLGVAYHF